MMGLQSIDLEGLASWREENRDFQLVDVREASGGVPVNSDPGCEVRAGPEHVAALLDLL